MTPHGYCHCGCGGKTTLIPCTNRRLGQFKGEPRKYITGHNMIGVSKKGGWTIDRSKNRWYITCRDGRKMAWYRIVAQNMIGRELELGEDVHHINGDCSDDRPENLEVLPHAEHLRLHMLERERNALGVLV